MKTGRKVGIVLEQELLDRIDAYADKNYMTRSGFISAACDDKLNAIKAMETLGSIGQIFQQFASTGTLDEDTLSQLDKYNNVLQLLKPTK